MPTEPKTFAELEAAPDVSPEEFMATFEDYAVSRAAICPRVVTSLIDRIPLTTTHRAEIRRLEMQYSGILPGGYLITAREYKVILDYLS